MSSARIASELKTHLYDVRDVAAPVGAECPDRRILRADVNDSFLPSATACPRQHSRMRAI
jgi:hypothetical protein